MFDTFKKIVKDRDRKKIVYIVADLIKLLLRHRSYNQVMLTYYRNIMFKRNTGNVNNYLIQREYRSCLWPYYTQEDNESLLLENKISLPEFLRDHKISTTKSLGKIESKILFDENGNATPFDDAFQLQIILKKLLNKYTTIFIKQTNTYGGKGVYKIQESSIRRVEKLNLNCSYVIEQAIEQHSYVKSINPSCINTLRVHSVRKGDKIYFPSCFFRMGIGGAYKDNSSSGGIYAPYDLETNTLKGAAYTFYNYGNKSFYRHPDTHFVFEGKQLPFSEEIPKILTEAALLFKKQLLAWDIAFTPHGPIIVEGNHSPHIIGLQVSAKGLLANSIYKELLASLTENKK